jgi:HSP20 family protein
MFSLMPRRRELNPMTEWFPREFASLFNRAFPMLPEPAWEFEPYGFEMNETETEVVVRATVPGFEPNELTVELTGNLLTLRAEHPAAEGTPLRRFERTVTVPAGIAPEGIEARYRNGILEVHMPRIPEAKPRRIEVKV